MTALFQNSAHSWGSYNDAATPAADGCPIATSGVRGSGEGREGAGEGGRGAGPGAWEAGARRVWRGAAETKPIAAQVADATRITCTAVFWNWGMPLAVQEWGV